MFLPCLKTVRLEGGDSVNYNIYRQLEKHFQCNYFHINPPDDLISLWKSKLSRKVLRRPGEFYRFSRKRLLHINQAVDFSVQGCDAVFFRGFTPWINCQPTVPYFAYNDINFQTFFENTFSYNDFIKEDLKRIFNQETSWLSNAKAVAYESKWGLQKCKAQYGLLGSNFHVIGRAGSITVPQVDKYKEGYNLVLIAKSFSQKGGFVAFEAFKKLRNDNSDFQFHIIGGDPGHEIRRYPGVVWHGFLKKEDKQSLIKFLDVLSKAFLLIHLTKEDANPLVITEAGYCGCPSISVDNFAIPELIKQNETGILLHKNATAEEVYSTVLSLVNDSVQYLQMRKRVWDYTRENFMWDAVGKKVSEMICSSLKI